MNEAETRAELIDPALREAGWGVVDGSRVRREMIAPGRLQGAGKRSKQEIADYVLFYRNQKLAVIEAKKSLKDIYDSTVNYLSEGLYAGKTVEEIFYLDDKDFIAWFTRNLDIGVELLDDLLVYYMKETG